MSTLDPTIFNEANASQRRTMELLHLMDPVQPTESYPEIKVLKDKSMILSHLFLSRKGRMKK